MKRILRLGLNDFSRFFLYLFFIVLPFQIGVLVYTPNLFESGFFNPFLSQWIYIGDLFLALSFLFFLFSPSLKFRIPNKLFFSAIVIFLFFSLISLVFSSNLVLSIFSFFRILEFFILYLLISSDFYNFKILVSLFVFSITFVAVIGIFQYLFQHSMGLNFLGESVLSPYLEGVSKIDFLGNSYLRAYGTFPHPNIFAAFLLFSLLISFHVFRMRSFLFIVIFFICFFAFILTFSRSAFLSFFLVFSLYGFIKIKSFWKYFLIFLLSSFFFILVFDFHHLLFERLFNDSSGFSERILYFSITKKMFFENIFGVGLSNFTLLMQDYSSVKLMPWLYQPVHNTFFLILNELGLQGLLSFVFLFIYSIYLLFSDGVLKNIFLISFAFLLLLLLNFDHYFFTLYQGQALLFFYFALVGRFKTI